ncbi:MAG: hypothetical protein A2181_08105 [Bdellovibrionales bacterium RIFOXYA1_FULL_38_20]|nr:MAG: hypothetical protein A2181_08105 [Bdellovibrionales bacterium RIFOXYA1_FULL_38_20]
MFLITGGLYTVGVKGDYQTQKFEIPLTSPLGPDLNYLEGFVKTLLLEKKFPVPSGNLSIKKAGTSWELEWTGARFEVVLAPTLDPNLAVLTLKKTTPHRFFVQLHKAKGGWAFKGLAVLFSLALLTLATTGLLQVSRMPRYKTSAQLILGAGFILFCIIALLS